MTQDQKNIRVRAGLVEAPFRANAKAVARNQRPDHQLGINRRPTDGAVKRRQLLPQPVKLDKPVDRLQQMRLGHMPLKRKLVEQGFLPSPTLPHHRPHPQSLNWIESAPPRADNSQLLQHNRAISADRGGRG
jgi:hypothetical protein